jgi:phospholipid/cholesterol/gamma-HCH transport system permease protein
VIIADLVGIYGGYIGYNVHGSIAGYQVIDHLCFLSLVPAIRRVLFLAFFYSVIGYFLSFNAKGGTTEV